MRGGIVFFAGMRGGVGKTVMTHAAALGAVLHNEPAVYVLTDPQRELREAGRPYGVLDGREPTTLAHILDQSRKARAGWTFTDGGGNRPAFDDEVAAVADLCFLLFRNTDEDIAVVTKDLIRIPKAIAWPTAWPTNPYALRAAQFKLDRLIEDFPQRVVNRPIPKVDSSSQLIADVLESPRTIVRNMARKVFDVIADEYDQRITEGR
jgi:chromosome partitioning protein